MRGKRARLYGAFNKGTQYSVLAACKYDGFIVDACRSIPTRAVDGNTVNEWAVLWLLPQLTEKSVVVAGEYGITHFDLRY